MGDVAKAMSDAIAAAEAALAADQALDAPDSPAGLSKAYRDMQINFLRRREGLVQRIKELRAEADELESNMTSDDALVVYLDKLVSDDQAKIAPPIEPPPV